MKVQGSSQANSPKAEAPKAPFKSLMNVAPKAPAKKPVTQRTGTISSAATVASMRRIDSTRAQTTLAEHRRDANAQSQHEVKTRATDLDRLSKGAELAQVIQQVALAPQPPPELLRGEPVERGTSASTVASTAELIEKIERWVRADRPGLSLRLNGPLAADVSLERVGDGRVAVTLASRGAAIGAEQISRLKTELAQRGVRVARLEVV